MISSIQASTLCDCFVGVNLIVARYKVLRQLFSFWLRGVLAMLRCREGSDLTNQLKNLEVGFMARADAPLLARLSKVSPRIPQIRDANALLLRRK